MPIFRSDLPASGQVLARIGGRALPALQAFRASCQGTTAIEMAIVSVPFFMMLFGLVGISSHFFVATSMDRGIEAASRLVRTGQAQTSGMTVNQFKQKICDSAGNWVKCTSMQLHVQSFTDWNSVAPQNCLNASGAAVTSTLTGTAPIATSTGAADQVVVVTACYKWDFAKSIPYIRLGKMSDGAMMMQAATVFRTEPYSTTSP